jgi:hypothetical protein
MKTRRVAVILITAVASACADQQPASPTAVPEIGPGSQVGLTGSPYGGNGVPLVAVAGSIPPGGSGRLNDPQTNVPGFNNFELNVNVHGGPPDTDLIFQFTADIVPGTRGDGSCPAFPELPAGGIGILHTSSGGSASGHLKFEVPEGVFFGAFDSGVKSDWQWRVVNADQTFELRTPCVVLTGK